MNYLIVQQLSQLYDILISREIVECNKFRFLTKDEIKAEACRIAKRDNISIITIGWNTDNPRICLNHNE